MVIRITISNDKGLIFITKIKVPDYINNPITVTTLTVDQLVNLIRSFTLTGLRITNNGQKLLRQMVRIKF